jgi:hypothetical protein
MTKKPCKGSHFLAESESELSRLVGLSSIVPLVPPHPKPCTPGPQSTRSADFSPQQADPTQPRSFPPAPSSRRRWLDGHGARTSVRSRPTPPSPRSIPFSAFKPKTLARSTRSTGLHPHEAFEMLRNKFRAPSKLGRSGSREADVHGGGGLLRSADFSPQHSRAAGRPFMESRIGDNGYHPNIQLRCSLRNTRNSNPWACWCHSSFE